MTGQSVTELQWCDYCQCEHPMPWGKGVCHHNPNSSAWGQDRQKQYGHLVKRLCGHVAQLPDCVPIRVYTGKPLSFGEGELSLWTDDDKAWAGFGGRKSLVSAFEVVELLAIATGTCLAEVRR